MDSYLGGLRHVQQHQQHCGVHLQLVNTPPPKGKTAQNEKAGSYGVSIRVQGINGHPYIVLNNTEGCLSDNHLVSAEDQQGAAEALESSALDSSFLPEAIGEDRQFLRTCNAPSGMSESLKPGSMDETETTNLHYTAGLAQSSSLLNFQRHPELLQPYDPEKNILDLEAFQNPPISQPRTLAGEEKPEATPWNSLDKTTLQFVELAKPKPKMVNLTKSAIAEDSEKQELECVVTSPNGMAGSLSSCGGSPPAIRPPTCQETRKCRPDLLPFRRQDSAGSVLNGSRRSSSSSTPPPSVVSLYKFFLDDQEYAIYADNVNRHENRRYIPFLPGTGRDIDTGSIPAVDQLIEKFDRKVCPQRRGRLGIRSRIHPEDRKRSRSVDSALSCGLKASSDCVDEFSKSLITSSEHLLQPSKVCLQKPLPAEQKSSSQGERIAPRTVGKFQAAAAVTAATRDSPSHHFNSLPYHKQNKIGSENLAYKSSTLPVQNKSSENIIVTSTLLLPNRTATQKLSVKTFASTSTAQVTPDLLKGQQELAQQTSEETAKQILYSYLKEGSSENDDATKRKVNLVFEKIQTLKSRAAGSNQVSDTSASVEALMGQTKELEKEVSELRSKLDLEVKKRQNVKEQREAMEAELRDLQRHLEESREEKDTLRRQLDESESNLRQHLQELFQVKMEREQHQTEIRDLQDQLSEMHDELDGAKQAEDGEREELIEELMQVKQDLQAVLRAKEQQDEVLRKRERELTALKGALKEEVSSHDQEMDRLNRELQTLRESLEEATKKAGALSSAQEAAEERQHAVEGQAAKMAEQNRQLQAALVELAREHKGCQQELDGWRGEREKMEQRAKSCEKEKQRLEEALAHVEEERQALALAKTSLEAQLEDAQRDVHRLSREQQQFTDRLQEEIEQKHQLKRMKSELEEEMRQLDKTVETLHKEMAEIVEVSRASTLELQNQLDEYKEKNRQELTETHRQLKDKNLELEKARLAALKRQEEVRRMEDELRDYQRAQDEAITKTQLLEQTVRALEYELQAKNHLKEDRARQAKIMEDKMSQLELDLEEERNNSDILSEKISRCREQIEQTRSELLQERAARQDLECDKISLERQNKDLKTRILHLEGSYRSSKEGLLVQMEARVMELEERLENEERDRANLQLSNRRLERKVKELVMQVDDEHLSLTDQKDQLSLRLKAMKRQVEEAEAEIDRLESAKKKLQREMEEQVDSNDQLQGQLNMLRKELSRCRKTSSNMLSDLDDDDDDFSTDGESLYEAPSGFKFLKEDAIKN